MTTILGIESTCDETAAAVVIDGRRVQSSVVATQIELHARYRGVVPEIASRAHIENLLPVLKEAIASAGVELNAIDAVAVSHRPGLVGSLLIGVTAAKTLAWSLGKPLIGVDHVQAHLYSVMLDTRDTPEFPAVGLVVSGGHTAVYRVRSWDDIELIGSTIDDAVGEAYDKVAAILGLGYPGGPILDKLAERGDPRSIAFPRTYLDRDSLDFSFSGLKTAVLYHVRGVPGKRDDAGVRTVVRVPSEAEIPDIAASFQAACVDVLTKKLKRAIDQAGARSVIVGGGVSANRGLRAALKNFAVPVHFPAMKFCTDNAAMIAGLANVYFEQKRFDALNLDAITHSRFRD